MASVDILVVGGGISGLFFTKRILDKKLSQSICLVESQDRLGGKVKSVKTKIPNGKTVTLEAGAGRFSKKHKNLIRLVKEYDLTDKMVKNGKKQGYYYQGHFYQKEEELPFDTDGIYEPLSLIRLALDRAKQAGFTKDDFYRYYSQTILKRFLSYDQYEYLNFVVSYYNELNLLNAETSLKHIESLISRKDDYFSLRGGIQQLVKHLQSDICRHNGKIHLNTQVTGFHKVEGGYQVQVNTLSGSKIYHCRHLVLATSPTSIRDMDSPAFKSEISPLLKSIKSTPLCRVYSVFPTIQGKAWFQGLPRITSDNVLRYTIPINPSTGVIMSTYTDGPNCEPIYQHSLKGDLDQVIVNTFRQMFPERKIHQAVHTETFYWPNGIHFYVPGVRPEKMAELSLQPTNENIYIIGEAFSSLQAWMEGGLIMASKLINILEEQLPLEKTVVQRSVPKTRHNPAFQRIMDIPAPDRLITPEELSQHNTVEKGAWIALFGNVYDVTTWIPKHPGGRDSIMKGVGKDHSFGFSRISAHRSSLNTIYKELKKRVIGRLVKVP